MNDFDIDELHVTEIYKEYECDVFFPEIPIQFTRIKEEKKTINNLDVAYTILAKDR